MSARVRKYGNGLAWSCEECSDRHAAGVYVGPLVEGKLLIRRDAERHNRLHHSSGGAA